MFDETPSQVSEAKKSIKSPEIKQFDDANEKEHVSFTIL